MITPESEGWTEEHQAASEPDFYGKWESVETNPPTSPGDYIVAGSKNRVGMAFWYMGDVVPIWDSCTLGTDPTHWMHLPPPPNK